ncbi:hypothetical protein YC2023_094164 [Brassica napus]
MRPGWVNIHLSSPLHSEKRLFSPGITHSFSVTSNHGGLPSISVLVDSGSLAPPTEPLWSSKEESEISSTLSSTRLFSDCTEPLSPS